MISVVRGIAKCRAKQTCHLLHCKKVDFFEFVMREKRYVFLFIFTLMPNITNQYQVKRARKEVDQG